MSSAVEVVSDGLTGNIIPRIFPFLWDQLLFTAKHPDTTASMIALRLNEVRDCLDSVLLPLGWARKTTSPSRQEILSLGSASKSTLSQIREVARALYVRTASGGSQEGARPLSKDLKATARAFDDTRFRNKESVEFLVDYISDCCLEWSDGSSYYAPYFALLNASMTGKSRLLGQLCSQGVFAMNSCYRPETNSSYRPPRTGAIADWATTPYEDQLVFTAQCCTFFEASLKQLLVFLGSQSATDTKGHARMVELATMWEIRQTSIWNDVHAEMIQAIVPADLDPSSLEVDKAYDIIDTRRAGIVGQPRKDEEAKLVTQIKNKLSEIIGGPLDKSKVHVVYVFDEARTIVKAGKNFQAFRRSMRLLPNGGDLNMLCVVTDTASSITNLAPPQTHEFSARARITGNKLFYPFVYVMGFDVWWNDAMSILVAPSDDADQVLSSIRDQLMTKQSDAVSLQQASRLKQTRPFSTMLSTALLESLEVLSMFGRPAFYPILCMRETDSMDWAGKEVVALLKDKLLCKPIASIPEPRDISDQANVAVLGAIASIEVSAASELATDLSAGHMRAVAGISEDRHMVYTLEISEPLLALAAHELIWDEKTPWKYIFRSFRKTQLNSSTMPGFIGETCAQILMLMAWQQVLRSRLILRHDDGESLPGKTAIYFVPVLEYLKVLLGESFRDLLSGGDPVAGAMKANLSNASVRVNQFVKTFKYASPQMLLAYLVRASGVACRELQPAADAIIAMYFSHSTSVSGLDFSEPLDPSRVRGFQVQVKHRSSALFPYEITTAFQKMRGLHAELNEGSKELFSISLLIELYSEGEARSQKMQKRAGPDVSVDMSRNIYEVHVKGLSAEHILKEDVQETDAEFRRLLQSVVDPLKSEAIPLRFRDTVTCVFPTQPYMEPVRRPRLKSTKQI